MEIQLIPTEYFLIYSAKTAPFSQSKIAHIVSQLINNERLAFRYTDQ